MSDLLEKPPSELDRAHAQIRDLKGMIDTKDKELESAKHDVETLRGHAALVISCGSAGKCNHVSCERGKAEEYKKEFERVLHSLTIVRDTIVEKQKEIDAMRTHVLRLETDAKAAIAEIVRVVNVARGHGVCIVCGHYIPSEWDGCTCKGKPERTTAEVGQVVHIVASKDLGMIGIPGVLREISKEGFFVETGTGIHLVTAISKIPQQHAKEFNIIDMTDTDQLTHYHRIIKKEDYKEGTIGKRATEVEPDDRCGNYNRDGCTCALLKHPPDCPTGGRGPCKDYKWGRDRSVNLSTTSKTDPFDAIRQKASEAFGACDHIDYSGGENAKWLPIVQGLIADIECYCDFLGDVEMPNKKRSD